MSLITAQSEAMREVLRMADRVAVTDANVLITGESGAGKGAVADYVHAQSKRAGQNFVKIDCGALPKDLLEAELFGYERGAFTGANESKPGRLEDAHKGSLLLDEIAHLPLDAQAKFLRVIERREFERLGGRRTIKVNTRLITLTNVDLEDAVKRRAFREDLFYRLNVVRLHIPSLSSRRADIPPLAREFVASFAAKHGRPARDIAPEVVTLLEAYEWPGNVRELANTIERAVIVAAETTITAADLPAHLRATVQTQQRGRAQTLAELEADYIRAILTQFKGNKAEAARTLGISRKNLYEKISRYGIGA
jgi:two-component system, NtrC family, response regulator AtoC